MYQRLVAGALFAALMAPPVVARGDDRGQTLVSAFLNAYQHTGTFTARLDVLTRKGSQASQMAVRVVYARPRNVALTVLDARQFPAANGTTLTWLGASRARVSTSFYGLPLAITVPVDDPRICNLRGYSIAQVDLGTEVPMLQEPTTRLRYLGEGRVNGRAASSLEVRSPHLLRGIEREVIWLDPHTHFPLLREMYESGRVVYRVAFSDYTFNPRVPPSLFAKF